MTSGHRILTLSADADLAPLAIPATSDATGSATYGNDGYWHTATALRVAFRGGYWGNGVRAGVFALNLNNAPSNRNVNIGFRACKYPRQHWPDPAGVILPAVPQETWGCNPRYIRLCRLAKNMNR